jgi:hypothetical protein
VSDRLSIDPESVEQASADVITLVDEMEANALELSDGTSNSMSGIDIGAYTFRQALIGAAALWAGRATGFRERLTDAAEFMSTNAAIARQLDADSAADFVELEPDAYLSIDQYSRADFYEQTGTPPPAPSGEDGAMSVDGESVAV